MVINGAANRDEIVLLFATERFMKVAFSKKLVVADGGFKHAPRRFKQVIMMIKMHTRFSAFLRSLLSTRCTIVVHFLASMPL